MSSKRKRGNGEGSIFRLPNGRWRAALMVGWRSSALGRRVPHRLVFTADTRHDVVELLTAKLRERDRGIPINVAKQNVEQFLTVWLENTVRPSVRPKTFRSYEQMVRNHLVKAYPAEEWSTRKLDSVPGLKDIELGKLALQQVQRFFNEKLKAGNSPALVRYLRVVLRIALNDALKADLVARNVAELATPPKVEKREIVPLTADQSAQLLHAVAGHRLEALFTCGLAIGLRSGECSALQWRDVDLDKGVLTVRHTLQRVKDRGLVLMPPKSEKSRRTIPLPEICSIALKTHLVRQQQERMWAGADWQETGHVFVTTIGTPIDDRKILKEFDTLVAAAKLPKQRFHDLRHACISLLGAQGVPLKVIAEIVGHSDIRLTQNVYQHVYAEAKADAIAKMNALLTGTSGSGGVATLVATTGESDRVN